MESRLVVRPLARGRLAAMSGTSGCAEVASNDPARGTVTVGLSGSRK